MGGVTCLQAVPHGPLQVLIVVVVPLLCVLAGCRSAGYLQAVLDRPLQVLFLFTLRPSPDASFIPVRSLPCWHYVLQIILLQATLQIGVPYVWVPGVAAMVQLVSPSVASCIPMCLRASYAFVQSGIPACRRRDETVPDGDVQVLPFRALQLSFRLL
jgi:hypothetical protein